ncbi:MAG: hypothetical protein R3C97_04365 [Geminicoccaceae bacterium]
MTTDLAACEAVVRAKLQPPVERIETHAAVILLGGDEAYKLKKRVAYSFLDFRTLASRERALRNELKLNRRTAPDLYLGVLPISLDAGRLELDGEGEPVDWVLAMRRFPQSARLDHVAEREGLSDRRSRRWDRDRPVPQDPSRFATGWGRGAPGNRGGQRGGSASFGSGHFRRGIGRASSFACDRHAKPSSRSWSKGVRKASSAFVMATCISKTRLVDGGPILFDAIEFNDAFAEIDTIYDIAFLVMDLLERRQAEAAWRLLMPMSRPRSTMMASRSCHSFSRRAPPFARRSRDLPGIVRPRTPISLSPCVRSIPPVRGWSPWAVCREPEKRHSPVRSLPASVRIRARCCCVRT